MLHKTMSGEPCGLVSNIQRYTIHDGPGIRTAIFFTGCTLRCIWCSNPETIEPRQRLGVFPDKCLSLDKCGVCLKVCPHGMTISANAVPIEHDANGIIKAVHMVQDCGSCLKCADECPPRAIKLWGEKMTLAELMEIVEADRDFYLRSGGGVTLSGGEVMLQWEFAESLLKACKDAGINTCVETALNCDSSHMEAVCRYTDLVITDIKHMDSGKHREFTGAGNELILSNIKRAAALGKKLIIRTPVVPGYNGDDENIKNTGAFIRDELYSAVVQYQLLPYKRLGTEKYASLCMPYPMEEYMPPERSEWESRLVRLAKKLEHEYGIPAVPGSSKKPEL